MKIQRLLSLIILAAAVGFNLWVYRLEPTALTDPNDNTFQYALVERTNEMWDAAETLCPTDIRLPFCRLTYLVDHWVPNWAEGYNLPYYYSHIPQITVVATHRLLTSIGVHLSLFAYYHIVIYLALCIFPLFVYWALRVIGMGYLAAAVGAFAGAQISTDGLYGLDPTSYVWRGYGLSSQLFASLFLPVAIAYAWRYLKSVRADFQSAIPAILTLAATTAGHLGIGIIAFLSVAILSLEPLVTACLALPDRLQEELSLKLIVRHLKQTTISQLTRLITILVPAGTLLAYWIVPVLIDGNYHNISVWDGIWKFDSFGARPVLSMLFNGALFDFGRFPLLTGLVLFGACAAIFSALRTDKKHTPLTGFSLLFLFWLFMYFGRTTWGSLIDLIPGMREFHISRFIVGVHIAGIFLIPVAFSSLSDALIRMIKKTPLVQYSPILLAALLFLVITPQTMRYARDNDTLILRANEAYRKDEADVTALLSALKTAQKTRPGRVLAGRGGTWGKDFRVAETPMYMYLSTYGIPTVLWLPETWSPNSDTEQYFSEGNWAHYNLYNVSYVVTPNNLPPEQIQPFWKPLTAGKTWKLYEIETDGYITSGIRPAIVSSGKDHYRSLVRQWLYSDAFTQGLYPQLTFDTNYPKQTGLPNFRMLDEVTYKTPDGNISNLFAAPPVYLTTPNCQKDALTILSQSSRYDMIFSATVRVTSDCPDAIIVLKQSAHPSWNIVVDDTTIDKSVVFPFFIASPIHEGTHQITAQYKPSTTKNILLLLTGIVLVYLGVIFVSPRTSRNTDRQTHRT